MTSGYTAKREKSGEESGRKWLLPSKLQGKRQLHSKHALKKQSLFTSPRRQLSQYHSIQPLCGSASLCEIRELMNVQKITDIESLSMWPRADETVSCCGARYPHMVRIQQCVAIRSNDRQTGSRWKAVHRHDSPQRDDCG